MKITLMAFAVALLVSGGVHTGVCFAAEASAGQQVVTKSGSIPARKGSEKTFTGNVRSESLFVPIDAAPYSTSYVTFEPGARTFWHIHPAGQRLVVTHGVGRVGDWNGSVVEVRPGDTIWCPPGVKHWHGATADSPMTHMTITGDKNGKAAEWLEEVTDEQYNAKLK